MRVATGSAGIYAGAGKTTILAALRDRGYAVVDEAATDVNVHLQALGRDERGAIRGSSTRSRSCSGSV